MTIAVPTFPTDGKPLVWLAGDQTASRRGTGPGREMIERIKRKKRKILVVDDERPFRTSLAAKLKKIYGAIVDDADGGNTALEKVATFKDFDLILMDISMPLVTGLDACELMRIKKVTARIVLMTAFRRPEYELRANELGVTIIQKPIDDGELQKVLLSCGDDTP